MTLETKDDRTLFFDMLPFVLTLLLLVFLGRRALDSTPAELRKVFDNARA